VVRVALPAGAVVEPGAELVALDASVEEAELRALEAKAALAESTLGRMVRAGEIRAASELEVDRSRAERDAVVADVARVKAVLAKKTVRAPFRAKVGLSDVHLGQYLDAGAVLTTLQSVEDELHVEFAAPQEVAARLKAGDLVEIEAERGGPAVNASIVAVDALVDSRTRNAAVRALLSGAAAARVVPGAAVRVRVPSAAPVPAVAVPADALRRGPEGDHVYVLGQRPDGKTIALRRPVTGGPLVGDEFFILAGLRAGERVASAGSFKLYDGLLLRPIEAAASRATR
jgi:membrane fusion protein (multidrug efflux system)